MKLDAGSTSTHNAYASADDAPLCWECKPRATSHGGNFAIITAETFWPTTEAWIHHLNGWHDDSAGRKRHSKGDNVKIPADLD